MKGLVLSGGAGKRMRPITHTGAKQLVPVANRPLIFYVIDNLVGAGVTDIGVVVSPETGAEVRDALGDGARWGARFEFIVQDAPRGLAHAVLVAREFLGGEDFCMYLGDNLLGAGIRDAADAFRATPGCEASVMLKEVPDPSMFGVAELAPDGALARLVEKPAEPRSKLALVGVYFFRSSIFQAISEITPSARGELEITDAISRILARGGAVRWSEARSWWLDTGSKDDLLLANETVLDAWIDRDVRGLVDAESVVVGRVRVEAGAEVVRSHVQGPAVIGAGARVVDSRIGAFTSLGDAVTVTRSRIERSVLMEGAHVEDVALLSDSLLGRRVRVQPGAARAEGLTLLLGDDCVVTLSTQPRAT